MDDRIEGFLKFVLSLEGKNSNFVRDAVNLELAIRERQFQDVEPDKNRKDDAARMCRELCRVRVTLERERTGGQRPPTI
jgi:hypothetical protein